MRVGHEREPRTIEYAIRSKNRNIGRGDVVVGDDDDDDDDNT